MKEKTETAAAMEQEQAAELAALQSTAAEQQSELDAAAGVSEPVAPNLGAELSHLVTAFVLMAAPILPSLKRIYTEETTAAACGAVGAVCEKHGWLTEGVMGNFGEEIAAAVILIPLAIATATGVRGDIAENKRNMEYIALKKQADLRQHMNIAHNLDGMTEPVTEGAATVTMGTPIFTGGNANANG